jgi:hypothetical protein
MNLDQADSDERVQRLFARLRTELPELEKLFEQATNHWDYEDPIYRFYHQSFKVYRLQETTERIVAALQALAPEAPLNDWFMAIIRDGTGKTFVNEHNRNWTAVTRPILEAFFHARFFLEMATRYGRKLEQPPVSLPSGWAAFLYLYNLR